MNLGLPRRFSLPLDNLSILVNDENVLRLQPPLPPAARESRCQANKIPDPRAEVAASRVRQLAVKEQRAKSGDLGACLSESRILARQCLAPFCSANDGVRLRSKQ